MVEYGALLLLVAAVLAALLSTGLGSFVAGKVERAACQVFDDDCEDGGTRTDGTDRPARPVTAVPNDRRPPNPGAVATADAPSVNGVFFGRGRAAGAPRGLSGGAGQDGADQDGAGQNGAGQDGAGQNGAGQNGAGQNGAGQDDDADQCFRGYDCAPVLDDDCSGLDCALDEHAPWADGGTPCWGVECDFVEDPVPLDMYDPQNLPAWPETYGRYSFLPSEFDFEAGECVFNCGRFRDEVESRQRSCRGGPIGNIFRRNTGECDYAEKEREVVEDIRGAYSERFIDTPFESQLLAAMLQEQMLTQLQVNRTLGIEGERLAGIKKNTERIRSPSRPERYRVPDALDHTAQVIGEVKNRARISLTAQLRDYIAYAQQHGYRFDLYVRGPQHPLGRSRLSAAVQREVDAERINLIEFP